MSNGMVEELYAGRCQELFFQFLALAAFRLVVDREPTEVRERMIENMMAGWTRIVEMQPVGESEIPMARRKQIHEHLRARFKKMLEDKIL